jgi:hypothetical protein
MKIGLNAVQAANVAVRPPAIDLLRGDCIWRKENRSQSAMKLVN